MRDRVDFSGAARRLGGREAAFAVDEVGGEDGVDEGGLAEPGLSYTLPLPLA